MWEYRIEVIGHGGSLLGLLRELGKEGWEAWHYEAPHHFGGAREVFFKREMGESG